MGMQVERFVIAPCDPVALQALVTETCAALRALLPAKADIQHIGSTAVPGCLTKGDLDLCVRVLPADFGVCEVVLARSLARNEGSDRNESFASFYLGEVGVQLVAIGSSFDDFTRFRDALLANPALVERYNALKQAWSGKPMAEYREAKGEFVEMVLKKTPTALSPWPR